MSATLLRGGRVYSSVDPFATALVIEGGSIAWVGSDAAAAVHAESVDDVIELDGALVTPAFVDAHVHTTSTGLMLTGLDLSTTTSAGDLLNRVSTYVQTNRAPVVLGHGWDETAWTDTTLPTRNDLDRAAFGAPVYLSRVDVHSCLASSALVAAAPECKALPGFDESGWLRQDAHHAVRTAAFDAVTPNLRRAAQRAALRRALSLGIGTIHELGGPQISGRADFAELMTLKDTDKPRIVGYWGEGIGPDAALTLNATGAAGDYFIDGAIGSRTALLVDPYSDDEGTVGAQYLTAAQMRDHIAACSLRGVQAGFHVIGDGAMELLAAAFVEAEEEVGTDVVRSAAHRLEHVEMVTQEQIELFARLGITVSAQPVFDQWWGGPGGMYETRLGSHRAPALNPFAAMLAAGVPVAFGSDAPVTPLAPWEAIRAAAHHHTPAHAISVRAAFAAHTRGGWRAAGSAEGGVIASGEPADLALWQVDELVVQTPDTRVAAWSTDPRSGVPPLPSVEPGAALPECLRTIVNGLTVYNARGIDEDGGEVS